MKDGVTFDWHGADLDPSPLEVVRRIKVDLLVTSRKHTDLARDLRQFQRELPALVLGDEPMWLEEIEASVAAALAL